MIRAKEKFQLKRKVGPYTISTINIINQLTYNAHKEFSAMFSAFQLGAIWKDMKKLSGWWETMVDVPEEGWTNTVRYKYKHRALQGHKEVIKKYEDLYNNSKKEQPEASRQES